MTARTPAGAPPRAARITILDILRALALLGIVTVHAHDHFKLYLPMPPAEGWQDAANSAADWAYEHLFVLPSLLLPVWPQLLHPAGQAGTERRRLPEALHVAAGAPVPAWAGAHPFL